MIENIYSSILLPWLILGLITFLTLLKVSAPYGKFSNFSWGPMISFKFGWILQEIISPLTFSYFFLTGTIENKSIAWIFFIIWNLHYFNRSIIFPLRKKQNSNCPIIIIIFAVFFNLVNGFINGYYLGNIFESNFQYLLTYNFICGFMILLLGIYINIISDNILLKLKKNNDDYQIPNGFLYNYVSCPNYLGEIVEWIGFYIMIQSIPALLFVLWTIFNLVPRAISHHRWYNKTFQNYPKERKAIIPFII